MIKAKLYNQLGEEKGEAKLSPAMFDVKVNKTLIHQVVVAQMANARLVLADTLGKGEVRGGGKKPWNQKGTGRARHGSIRSPLWRGGGVTFGPKSDRNFTKKVNKKMKQLALFGVLTDKAASENVVVFEDLKFTAGKTKELATLLKKVNLINKGLLVIDSKDKDLIKVARNIKALNVLSADSLNVYDILKCKNLIFTETALKQAGEVYKSKK